ncbi:unnamed protein product [Ixodes pacificus]
MGTMYRQCGNLTSDIPIGSRKRCEPSHTRKSVPHRGKWYEKTFAWYSTPKQKISEKVPSHLLRYSKLQMMEQTTVSELRLPTFYFVFYSRTGVYFFLIMLTFCRFVSYT